MFGQGLLYNSRFVNRANIPPKGNMWPCWPLYLFIWARDWGRSKKNPSLISNRTSHLTSSNFQRTNEKFVQLHVRHFKITIFFFTFLIKCGIVIRSWLAWRDICGFGVKNLYQEPLDFLPMPSWQSFTAVSKSSLVFLIYIIIYFFQEYRPFCAVPFYNLFAALRVIYSRWPSPLFVIILRLFKRPGVLVFRVLVFWVLGLSFPDTPEGVFSMLC